jgi:hypothetical protein
VRFVLIASILLFASRAAAQRDGVYVVRSVSRPSPRTIEIDGSHAQLVRRLPTPRSHWLASTANDNRAYSYAAEYRGTCSMSVVVLADGVAVSASGWGSGNGQCRYDFPVDRAMADRIAHAFGIERHDRSSSGDRVTVRFSTDRMLDRGAPIVVRATFTNPAGAATVQREVGCVRFSFVIYRDGRHVATLDPPPSGCPVGFVPEAGGTSADDSVDVRPWANNVQPGIFDTPGRYRLECRYDTSFAPDGARTFDAPYFSAQVWDRSFTGVVDFEIH